jgi:hypothetical protein
VISSQLGRMILAGSTASSDEMRAVPPDADEGYASTDGLLEEICVWVRIGTSNLVATDGPETVRTAD